jgi:hypothetical protein
LPQFVAKIGKTGARQDALRTTQINAHTNDEPAFGVLYRKTDTPDSPLCIVCTTCDENGPQAGKQEGKTERNEAGGSGERMQEEETLCRRRQVRRQEEDKEEEAEEEMVEDSLE